ncbi:MAG: organic solvent tolerance protein OstA [Planctomycetota bacterium]
MFPNGLTGCLKVCAQRFNLAVLLLVGVILLSQSQVGFAQVTFPRPNPTFRVKVDASEISHWNHGGYEVLHLKSAVNIVQGNLTAKADEGIVWVEIPDASSEELIRSRLTDPPNYKVIIYLEGNVEVEQSDQNMRIVDDQWFGRLFTSETVDLDKITSPLKTIEPEIFLRAQQVLATGKVGSVSPAAFNSEQAPDKILWAGNESSNRVAQSTQPQVVINPQTGQLQSISPQNMGENRGGIPQNNFAPIPSRVPLSQQSQSRSNPGQPIIRQSEYIDIVPRDGSVAMTLRGFPNELNPNETVSIGSGGIRITIDSPRIANQPAFQDDRVRQLIISADSIVQWQLSLPNGTERNQFYLEGNIVFAKGSRVIYAERMFYDVETQQGTILKAEILTPIQNIEGTVRMKADVIRQLDANNLQAYGAAFTSSRLGVPRYWLQSESIGIQQIPGQSGDALVFDPNQSVVNGIGEAAGEGPQDEFLLDSRKNRVFVAGLPVFAWPRLQTDLNNPTLFLERLSLNNDRIFGFQLTSAWNMYQLIGRRRPIPGTNWTGLLDYLSDRGVGFGTEFTYERDSFFGIPGRTRGRYDTWFINDSGLDSLGRDRRDLTPEEEFRGRAIFSHRQDFAPGYQLRAEVGYISDRNFLEQYYEREWDTRKDATTGIWLERNSGTNSFNLTADAQLNDFFTQTSGVKFDWFKLGQPIFNNNAIWHSRTYAGYERLRQAEPPTDATDAAKFDPLAWETDAQGMNFGTRHEIDIPLQIGPVKVVPYVLGDASYWQEARDGEDLFRVYGQTGVRASLPMWRVDPSVQSVLWNVNGLAHKVTLDLDAFYADTSQDLDELALYNPLDDDSQEHFRRRFAFDTFGILPGGDVPIRFDERNFAFRSGLQGNVTSPSEIADDLAAIKFGVRQRWQTKRGLPGREHIIDWITLDAQATLFPNAQRDNFGSDFGMFDYDFRWYVGDRVSLVSDGYFDFFSQGLRTASFGANLSRPEIGNVYVGFRSIEGPISSNILSGALTYRMSDKWGVKAGGQVDFGETGTIGNTLSLVYIGESFLWQFGFNYDHSRDNFGFRFGFEPRFSQRPRLFRPGGSPIPPSSSRWLE